MSHRNPNELSPASVQVAAATTQLLHSAFVHHMIKQHGPEDLGESKKERRNSGEHSSSQQDIQSSQVGAVNASENLQAKQQGRGVEASSSSGSPSSTGPLQQGLSQGIQAYHLLEGLGKETGVRLVERLVYNKPLRLFGELTGGRDKAMAFVAGELWPVAFEKKPDHLKLRRDGSYSLKDEEFRWLRSVNVPKLEGGGNNHPAAAAGGSSLGRQQLQIDNSGGLTHIESVPSLQQVLANATAKTQIAASIQQKEYLLYPCGIIRGALTALGFPNASVGFAVEGHAAVTFFIEAVPRKQ